MSWEISLFDWSGRGANDVAVYPEQVLALLTASTEDEATSAYWKLDGVVCANGLVYGIALNVVRMILAHLPSCTVDGKLRCLELLAQISVCESDVSAPGVALECLAEMKQSSWSFLNGLQFDAPEIAWLYVDLIGALGQSFEDFSPKAIMYLECVLLRDLPANDLEMTKNTLADLKNQE